MSFDNDVNQTTEKPAAFCQNCGKPLDINTMRVVASSVFCEPCLAARIGIPTGAPASGPTTGPDPYSGYNPVAGGAPTRWTTPPPYGRPSVPNPGLAALLGFIPGVGAMYNEQYAKGIVHLLVFATLVSLSHSAGIFGLFVAGWVFYMVIEAHHTARARRDGTPLPNPFGLNDLSERLGFGRNWSSQPTAAWPNPPAQPTAAQVPVTPVVPAEPWGAPVDAGFNPSAATPPYVPPTWQAPPDPIRQDAAYAQNYGQPYAAQFQQSFTPNTGYYPPAYTPVQAPPPNPFVAQAIARRNRFPAGAIWLIALGLIFLLATTGIFEGMYGESLVGFALIGLAVYFFLKRMLDSGVTIASDGNPNYPLRVVRALRVSVWLFLIGLLIVLNSFSIVYWSHSWPWLIVVAGVMMIIERTAFNSAAMNAQYMPPPPYATPPVSTSIVPTHAEPTTPEGGN